MVHRKVAGYKMNLIFLFRGQVGAPPEIACLLEEIRRENDSHKQNAISTCFGADPELDEFMVMVPPPQLPTSKLGGSNQFCVTENSYRLSPDRKRTVTCW